MQCQWTFSNMHIFAELSGCPVVTSNRTHIGIRCTVSLHSEHVYMENLWVEMTIKMDYIIVRYSDVLQTLVIIENTHLS